MILWAWGVAVVALVFTDFLTGSVDSTPWRHSIEFLFGLLVLLSLSVVTWLWLGDRGDDPTPAAAKDNQATEED